MYAEMAQTLTTHMDLKLDFCYDRKSGQPHVKTLQLFSKNSLEHLTMKMPHFNLCHSTKQITAFSYFMQMIIYTETQPK